MGSSGIQLKLPLLWLELSLNLGATSVNQDGIFQMQTWNILHVCSSVITPNCNLSTVRRKFSEYEWVENTVLLNLIIRNNYSRYFNLLSLKQC